MFSKKEKFVELIFAHASARPVVCVPSGDITVKSGVKCLSRCWANSGRVWFSTASTKGRRQSRAGWLVEPMDQGPLWV